MGKFPADSTTTPSENNHSQQADLPTSDVKKPKHRQRIIGASVLICFLFSVKSKPSIISALAEKPNITRSATEPRALNHEK